MDNFSDIINDHEEDFLNSFLEQINEQIAVIESSLMLIHNASNKFERLSNVMSAIQKIEEICRVACLDPLIWYMNKAEKIVSGFGKGKLNLTEQTVEVFLLMNDILRNVSEDIVKIRVLDVQLLEEFGTRMEEIYNAAPHEQTALLEKSLLQFSIRVKKDIVFNTFEEEDEEEVSREIACALEDKALSKFWNLADALEMRFPHWKSRTDKILQVSLLINKSLENVIDNRQLTAAVYLHDIGMGLLPDSIIYKHSKYDSEEAMLMQNHPHYAHDILSSISGFEDAAEMVLQHHEWFDGKGYPAGLKYGDITAGAQILAVTDTFYALTHSRPDRNYNKSIVRALSEINRKMGTQFDPQVVEAINAVAKQIVELYERRPPA